MTATIRSAATTAELAAPFLLSIDVAAGRVAIHGDFDRQHVDRFLDVMSLLAYSPSPLWSVDVSAVSFCDAGGLRGLLAAKRLAEDNSRTFRVTRAGPWMRHLLPMIGLSAATGSARILRVVR
jgi:anti-anti-sigma regulatory factor